jgi:hypothetical protein
MTSVCTADLSPNRIGPYHQDVCAARLRIQPDHTPCRTAGSMSPRSVFTSPAEDLGETGGPKAGNHTAPHRKLTVPVVIGEKPLAA